jgi:hypothetical protein
MLYIVNKMSLFWSTKQLAPIAKSIDECYQHKTINWIFVCKPATVKSCKKRITTQQQI